MSPTVFTAPIVAWPGGGSVAATRAVLAAPSSIMVLLTTPSALPMVFGLISNRSALVVEGCRHTDRPTRARAFCPVTSSLRGHRLLFSKSDSLAHGYGIVTKAPRMVDSVSPRHAGSHLQITSFGIDS